ncbi:NB-ARC domain-containing protein [Methanothrix harundinacea]|uniref:NB-ARC domain-containing protein n=1 Tax=Methanothrix harundinacea TaxID=301375 RepID=UPI001E357773|nr:NB-ARC domain-containing protein [Methanothrix harundinacea]
MAKADEPVVVTGASKVGLHGMGGIGKSVMAAAVARDEETQRAFPDGILWLTLGINPKLLQRQSDLAVMLGDVPHAFNDIQEGKSHLSSLLADKVCLIILDDVWNVEHVEGFNILGSGSKMLITTRDAKIITALDAQEHRLGVLDDDEALSLLAKWTGQSKEELPSLALEVAKECGNLPLALAMVGAMVKGMPDLWTVALERLQNADLEKIREQFPDYPYPDLLKAIQVSVDALEPEFRARYLDLAVFPEDIPIPEAALQTFWEGKEFTPPEVIKLLVDRSLLLRDDEGRLSLHDLTFDYVRKQAGDLKTLHDQLLESYSAKYLNNSRSPSAWAEGPKDGYFFQHLARHLKEAGQEDELRALLFDFNWIKAKLAATDVPSLLVDYDLLTDPDAVLVRDALRLSAHVISVDKAQLASQILGRLMALPSSSIQALLDGAGEKGDEPWIRPLTPNLMPPGTPLLRTLKGHSSWVNAVAVSPDGRRAVSASYDNTLKVWDLERGEEIRTLKGHSNWVSAVAVSPDGRRALSGSYDNTLKVWDLERGEEIRTLKGHYGWVSAVAVSPDGRRAVSGSYDNTLKVWDLEKGEEILTLKGHSASVRAVAVTPDGRKAVSASGDQTLKVWDLEKGEEILTLKGHSASVSAVAVTPDGRKAVSASGDQTLKVWDLEKGEEIRTLKGHSASVRAVAVTPDGRKAVSSSGDQTLKVWDLERGEELRTLKGHSNWVNAVAVTPDGRKAVSSSGDKTLKVWDLERGEELQTLKGHSASVSAVALTPDGRKAVSSSGDKTLKVWDLEKGEEIRTLKGHSASVSAVAVTPDGRKAISACDDRTLKVWDLERGEELRTLKGHSDWVNAVVVTPDGQKTVSASDDQTLKVWDLGKGEVIATFTADGPILCCAIAPDGATIVAGESSGRIHLLRLENAD